MLAHSHYNIAFLKSSFLCRFVFTNAINPHSFSALFGSLVFLCWLSMLVFQGEGIDLDMQRSRNPMWEWLFSHPVKPAGVFLAELLTPMAANPLYITAPAFIGFLYGWTYGGGEGILAAFLVGLPVTSHINGTVNTSTFDGVAVTTP